MNLEKLINQSPYNLFLLVVNPFFDIKLPKLKNFYSIQKPKTKNSGRLLKDPETQNFINSICQKNNKKAAIIPFKPSPKISHLCQKNNWLLVANPPKLNRFFEDKVRFSLICQKHHLPIVPTAIDKFNSKNFKKYQTHFASPLVIQTRRGWTGQSTFKASRFSQIKQIISPQQVVKFSPLLPGYTLLNNCCLTKKGLIQSPPALQFTGLKPFTQNPFTTVGRQWPCLAPAPIQNQVKKLTQSFADLLAQKNYLGFFGLDFLVSQSQVYLLECNPRLTASFSFYTKLEQKHHLDPLFLFHLAEFLDLRPSFNLQKQQNRFNLPLVGHQLTYKDSSGNTTKVRQDFKTFVNEI